MVRGHPVAYEDCSVEHLTPVAFLGRVGQRCAEGGPDLVKGNAGATKMSWPVDLAVGALYVDVLVCEDFRHLVDGEVG